MKRGPLGESHTHPYTQSSLFFLESRKNSTDKSGCLNGGGQIRYKDIEENKARFHHKNTLIFASKKAVKNRQKVNFEGADREI